MYRAVLDTNILTAALRSSGGASFKLLELATLRRVQPVVTTALLLEYEAVLTRPAQMAAHGMTMAEVSGFLADFTDLSDCVTVHFAWRPQLPDPADEMVLDAAINGQVHALLTYNVRDLAVAYHRFRVPVMEPADFLKVAKP